MGEDERRCPVCAAVFATDAALGSHLAVCIGGARAEARRPPPPKDVDVDDARGRVLCYVCGQRVLTPASLGPHLKKCERAARCAHRLDDSQLLPTKPCVAPPTDASDAVHIKAWNVAARSAFEASLPNCKYCDRRFASVSARDAHAKRCAGVSNRDLVQGEPEKNPEPSMLGAQSWALSTATRAKFLADPDPAVARVLSSVGTKACVCVFCGSACLPHGLEKHSEACEGRWRRAELARPLDQRRDAPRQPTWLPVEEELLEKPALHAHRAALQAYNRTAARIYVEAARRGESAQCGGCGRRFVDPETREKHERRCAGLDPDVHVEVSRRSVEDIPWRETADGAARKDPVQAAFGAACHLCGKPCLVNSLRRHIRRCTARWELFERNRPMGEDLRPVPREPSVPTPPPGTDFYRRRGRAPEDAFRHQEDADASAAADGAARLLLDTWNAAAVRVHGASSEFGCEACGRTFAERAVRDTHARRCQGAQKGVIEEDTAKVADAAALCPICGRRCLLGSFLQHLDACKTKFEEEEALKGESERRPAPCWPDLPLPVRPGKELNEWNAAIQTARNVHKCPGCARGFEQSRAFEAHVKRCCPEQLATLHAGDAAAAPSEGFVESGARDPTTLCFICGKRCGTAGLGHHTRACAAAWTRCNEQLPVAAQRVLEFPPADLWPPPVDDVARREQYEAIALELHKKLSLMKCYGCERTFSDPEARDKHAKKCCPELMAEAAHVEEDDVVGRSHDLSPTCYVCGKTCATLAGFKFHVAGCKARHEAQLALEVNGQLPQPPAGLAVPGANATKDEITVWNAAVSKQRAMLAQNMCPGDRCGRTFETAAKLEQHMNACCASLLHEREERKRLRALVQDLGAPTQKTGGVCCHLCGRHVLHPRSLPFHFRSCLRRFYSVEDQKPAAAQHAAPPAPALPAFDLGDEALLEEDDESDAEDSDYGDDFEADAPGEVEASSKRPVVRMCYCCGSTRESERSIKAHVALCRKRWLKREGYRPTAWRRPLPAFGFCRLPGPAAPSDALVAYSQAAEALAATDAPHRCPACARTFADPGKLAAHCTSCRAAPKCGGCGMVFEMGLVGEEKSPPASRRAFACPPLHAIFVRRLSKHQKKCEKWLLPAEVVVDDTPEEKRGVHCYLCGRRCLLASLALHVPKCKQRWLRENSVKPRKHGLCFGDSDKETPEVEAPAPPRLAMPTAATSKEDRDAYSEEALRIFERGRPHCVWCRRAFEDPDKLAKHHGNCTSVEAVFECELDANSLLLALDEDPSLAIEVDDGVRARLGRRMDVDPSSIRIIKADLGARLEVTARVFGVKNAAPLTRRAILDGDAFSTTPVLRDLCGAPTVLTARIEASLGRLALVSDPRALTFYVAFIKALEEARARRRGSGDLYQVPVPIKGRVITNHRTKDRKRRQDLVDKRNKELSTKIRNVKGVLDFSHRKTPKHCHNAVNRKREDKERRRENAKIERALRDIYRGPSRLENFGVKGKDVNEEMKGRTALYGDGPKKAWVENVPHNLTVAQCAACGVRSFYGSDGTPMAKCALCNEVYYCDATCAAVDAPAHALTCAHARGRAKWPTKLAQFWIQSRATVVATAALRRRPKPSVEVVMREVAMAQATDARADADLFREVPKLSRAEQRNLAAAGPHDAPTDAYRRAELDADHAAYTRLHAARLADEHRRGYRADAEARLGSLDDNLRRVEARALELAMERRQILLTMNATRARDAGVLTKPPRAARQHGAEREKRLMRERAALTRTPRAASQSIGDHAPYTKAAPVPGVGKRGFSAGRANNEASSFKGAVPGFDVAGQLFVRQFAGD